MSHLDDDEIFHLDQDGTSSTAGGSAISLAMDLAVSSSFALSSILSLPPSTSLMQQHAPLHRYLQQDEQHSQHNLTATTTTSPENNDDDDDDDNPNYIVAEVLSNFFLFLLIFGMSATVDITNLKKQIQNKFAILTGIAMQFLFMPFLGFLSVKALQNYGLAPSMGLTLLIVTSSPGGSYSNWWCSIFNADLALSVAMTALSTIMSTFLLPGNLLLYSHAAYGFGQDDNNEDEEENILKNVDWKTLFISLGIVIAAILSGIYSSYRVHSHRFQRWANRLGSLSGVLLIVFSFVVSSGGGGGGGEDGHAEAKLWEQHWSFYLGVAAPCVLGLVLANAFSRCANLKKPECVTLSVECCYQNVGIATSAAVSMFDDPQQRAEALAVPLFYGFVEAVLLGLYCIVAWKLGWTKAPKDEKICVVIAKTYEVEDDEIEEEGVDSSEDEGGEPDMESNEENENAAVPSTAQDEMESSNKSSDRFRENTSCSPSSPITWFGWILSLLRPRRNRRTGNGVRGLDDPVSAEQNEIEREFGEIGKLQAGVSSSDPSQSSRARVVSEDLTAATASTGDDLSHVVHLSSTQEMSSAWEEAIEASHVSPRGRNITSLTMFDVEDGGNDAKQDWDR